MKIDGRFCHYKKKIQKLFELAGKIMEENLENASISINFVTEKKIRQLNNKFRNIDKVTDVLSFPNLDKKPEQKLKDFSKDMFENELFLGDIVICKAQAKRQAKEYNHKKSREICFLALHGFLHLMGYDHIKKEDEAVMQALSEKILTQFGEER